MRTPLAILVVGACVVGAACGGSDSTAPTNTKPQVTQVGIFWGNNPSPCQSATTMTFTVQVLNANVGDALVVSLTGPGMPGTINESLTASSQLVQHTYPVAKVGAGSSATWTAVIQTVGGVKPDSLPGGHTGAQSSVTC